MDNLKDSTASLHPNSNGTPIAFPKTSQEALASASKFVDTATEWAKKNPLPAAAIGVGVGYLLGTFVRRLARGK